MKILSSKARIRGLTLAEVLVVLVVLFVMAIVFLPMFTGGPVRAWSVVCLSSLKQIELGFQMWAYDNGGEFPMQIPVANGGTMEFIYSDHTFPHFQKLQKYGLNPKNFVCPLDKAREAATNYEALSDLHLSYFLNADATTNNPARSILSGDRFIQANGQPVNAGLLLYTTNMNMSWTPDMHRGWGNLVFTDGHAERTISNRLNSIFQNQPAAINRLSIP